MEAAENENLFPGVMESNSEPRQAKRAKITSSSTSITTGNQNGNETDSNLEISDDKLNLPNVLTPSLRAVERIDHNATMMEERAMELFYEMIGVNEQIKIFQKLIEEPLTNTNLNWQENNINTPKAIILSGPSGTGKSYLVRMFAKISSATLITVLCEDLVRDNLKNSAKIIMDSFHDAQKQMPSILLFKNIEAFGSIAKHNNKSDIGYLQTTTELLNQLDSFNSRRDMKIIATTNHLRDLSRELIGHGRFECQIEFPFADLNTKHRIFDFFTSHMTLSPNINKSAIINNNQLTAGDIKKICYEASLLVASKNRSTIEHSDFMLVKYKVIGTKHFYSKKYYED